MYPEGGSSIHRNIAIKSESTADSSVDKDNKNNVELVNISLLTCLHIIPYTFAHA